MSGILSFSLWGLFDREVRNKIFITQTHLHLLIPILLIAFLFSLVYFIIYIFLSKYSKVDNQVSKSSIIVWIILGYLFSVIVGEFFALISNNFGDTMNCRGTGCVGMVMTIYGRLSIEIIPIFLILMFILFLHQLNTDLEESHNQ